MSWLAYSGNYVKRTLKRILGEGAALLDSSNGADTLYDVLKAMIVTKQNRILSGLFVKAPTNASTQATGAGTTVWRVDIEKGLVIVDNKVKEFTAQADLVVHSGSQVTGFDALDTVVAAIVAKNVSGTITCVAVKGDVQTTASGLAVGPTDAVIQAAVGAGIKWVKIGETTLNRTADTTVTQTYDNAKGDYGNEVIIEP